MKTEAIVFVALEKAELREVELPPPTPRDVVIEVETSGISVGTERWAYLGKRPEISFPNIPGYMGIGRITEAGAEARGRGYIVGDRINFFRSRLAGDLEKTSWMGTHLRRAVVDVLADVYPDPEALDVFHCAPLPEGLDPVAASLTGLGGVALRGIEMAGIPMGTKVLVVGLGIIGQFAAQICRLKGAKVAAADIVPFRLDRVRENGADWVIHSKDEDLASRAREIAPRGFDVIIDTSSSPAVVKSLVPLLRLRGRFVFQGWYPPPSSIDLDAIQQRLATCYFPCAHSDGAVRAAMQWARDGHLKIRNLVTHCVPPAEAVELYQQIGRGSEGFLGAVIDWRS